jgi:hypothetical protein
MKKRKYKIDELEFFNNVEIPSNVDKENNRLEHIALGIILVLVSVCGFLTFYLYQLEKISNMEDKLNELRDKRDVLVEELASVEDKISKTPTDALEYDTLCQTQDTIEEQIEVIDKEIIIKTTV